MDAELSLHVSAPVGNSAPSNKAPAAPAGKAGKRGAGGASSGCAVLQWLRDNHLYAKMSKCLFSRTELEFLGHILHGDGLRVDPKKTSAVADWPVPKDVSQLRSFLGMAEYFKKFIHHFAQRTMPLTRMLRKVNIATWQWTPESQAAFEDLKDALTTAPVLASLADDRPYVLFFCGMADV